MSEQIVGATEPVVDSLVRVSFAVMAVLTRSSAEHDVSVTQLRLLGILRDRTPTMAAIAAFLGLDRSSVSGLIDRAERRDLVERRTSTDDARVTIVHLTTAGTHLADDLAATVTAGMEELLARTTDAEKDQLVAVAASIINTPGHPVA